MYLMMIEREVQALSAALSAWRHQYVYGRGMRFAEQHARSTLERHAQVMNGVKGELLAKYGRVAS